MSPKNIAFILNVLRQGTIKWPGRSEALKKARKRVIEEGEKKFYWQCNHCKYWFRDMARVQVDHIVEVDGFKGSWDEIITKMYDVDNLQVLCQVCHLKKTQKFMNAKVKYQRVDKGA